MPSRAGNDLQVEMDVCVCVWVDFKRTTLNGDNFYSGGRLELKQSVLHARDEVEGEGRGVGLGRKRGREEGEEGR